MRRWGPYGCSFFRLRWMVGKEATDTVSVAETKRVKGCAGRSRGADAAKLKALRSLLNFPGIFRVLPASSQSQMEDSEKQGGNGDCGSSCHVPCPPMRLSLSYGDPWGGLEVKGKGEMRRYTSPFFTGPTAALRRQGRKGVLRRNYGARKGKGGGGG